ncbi:hypothetical protein [Jidongwangia harbinensis]|uniref:hypothetical protein n=1 Tax=Jidongwangia harbinensis TaxID=2878561 RepID=UPI002101EDAC|nr:hypothetical protein [Jidongwangia harbinensis]
MTDLTDYARPAAFTDLSDVPPVALDRLPDEPVPICDLVRHLVVHPDEHLPAFRRARLRAAAAPRHPGACPVRVRHLLPARQGPGPHEWGRMAASYRGETGAGYDALMDRIATVCAVDDPAAVAGLYATEDLTVPPELVRAPRS